tara:strand:- start:652 stop:1095 length:444 start_codon:yes stop_codon:yes gene_type:complete
MKKPGKFKKKFTHSYAELAKVGRQNYRDKGYCAVIAAAVINDWSFGIAKAKLESRGYRHHCGGVYYKDSLELYAEHGKVAIPVDPKKFGKNLYAVSKNVPKDGRYVFHIKGHIAAVRNGVLEDWSAGLKKSLTPILGIHKIEDIAGV